MRFSKALAAGIAAVSVASAFAVSASAYNAHIGYQTTTYSFRNGWDDATYGEATEAYKTMVVWGVADTDPDTFGDDYSDYFDYDIGGYLMPASYSDTTFAGAGTYTVSVDSDVWDIKGDSDFNLVFVSTDAPNDGSFVCTNAKVIVDGVVAREYDDPVCDETQAYFNISLANIWNPDIGTYGAAYPTKTLAIEFTIATAGEEPAAAAEEPAAPAEEPAAPAAGDVAAATDSSKGSPDTGIEDVAVIGGLAILAGAAIAFTRKRK